MSDNTESAGEKSHDPTDKKLEDARNEGNVAKSADAGVAAAYLGLILALTITGASAALTTGQVLTRMISDADLMSNALMGSAGIGQSGEILKLVLWAILPVFGLPALAVLLTLITQQSITVSGSKLSPKLDRINPIKGAAQKFGPTGIVEFLKSAVKLIIVAIALVIYLMKEADVIVGLANGSAGAVAVEMGKVVLDLVLIATSISIIVAGFDILWQKFDHRRKLRMSHQDLKDENKQAEGDPHTKSQRRQRARDIASNRMFADLPTADVVMVNPTYIAIALKWDRSQRGAPTCIAKGEGEIAARMREVAAEHAIPLHRDVIGTRALYPAAKIGHEIPESHYRAVAAAIRFADTMRSMAKGQH